MHNLAVCDQAVITAASLSLLPSFPTWLSALRENFGKQDPLLAGIRLQLSPSPNMTLLGEIPVSWRLSFQ